MDEEMVTIIFSKLLTSMNEHFHELTASLLEKLNSNVELIETKYKSELKARDQIINDLIQKNDSITKERDELKEKLQTVESMRTPESENEIIPDWNEVGHAPIEPPLLRNSICS